MEIKVRDLGSEEAKSSQQIEQELLDKHEQSLNEEKPVAETVEVVKEEVEVQQEEQPKEEKSLSDEDVLSYISERYGKKIDSFDELVTERSESPDLPEDIAAYYKYKQETGRGMDDFVRLNKSSDDMDDDDLLLSYYMETEEGPARS